MISLRGGGGGNGDGGGSIIKFFAPYAIPTRCQTPSKLFLHMLLHYEERVYSLYKYVNYIYIIYGKKKSAHPGL